MEILASLLAQASDTPSFTRVVEGPLIYALLGGAVYGALYYQSVRTRQNLMIRHIGTGLIGIAFLMSLGTLLKMTGSMGEFYRAAITSEKSLMAHYAMPIVTFGALGTVLYLERTLKFRSA